MDTSNSLTLRYCWWCTKPVPELHHQGLKTITILLKSNTGEKQEIQSIIPSASHNEE